MVFTKRVTVCLLAIWTCVAFASTNCRAQAQKIAQRVIELDSGWEFRQGDQTVGVPPLPWRPAQVPGDVHLDLLRNGMIPQPFYRDNEAKLQWIQDAGWEYRTTIDADSDLLQHRQLELVFEGLDAAAEVTLNGHKLLSANNMFRSWRVNAKPYLHPGANQLLVVFPSAVKAAAAAASEDKWRAQTQTAEKTYIRKAAYEYGWDWGPTFVTSGIWRPAKLVAWDEARISNLYIRQRDISPETAHLAAEVEVTAAASGAAKVTISMESPAGPKMQFSRAVTLQMGANHISFPIEVVKPELWFPVGYGAHPVYRFHATVSTGQTIQDEATTHVGLRSVELRRVVDQWGRSFEFVINGIPIFAKGADVIPFDSFPNRVKTAQYRRILQSAVDANMNMIRDWGGGYYETDEFYDMCDELGLMVWQDFMFGNEWQPGTYPFKQNVEREAEDQVRRLRNHPSIVLWCGNNETEISWDWERTKAITDHLSSETRRRMWQDYLTLFSGIIPRTVARLNPETPYWPSSPSADYEDVSDTYQSGDMHDWSVWHGRAPFSDYTKHFPRFMSEYGFQSFPEMRTVKAFTLPEDRTSIFTPVMLAHQKNDEGNAIIHDYMLRYYGEPRDFASLLYASQVLQAEGVKIGAEHLRRIRPRSMGSLYWQINDCWPVASWSSIDYYGRWKALQYYARRFYSPVLVSPAIEDGSLAIYVVSDKVDATNATLHLRIMKFNGDVVRERSEPIQVEPLESKVYLRIPIMEIGGGGMDLAKIFAAADLTINGKEVSSNIVYFVPTKQIELPHAVIVPELTKNGDDYRLRLSANVLARSVSVAFGDYDADLSDDYFDLLPGKPLDITVRSKTALEQLRAALAITSLSDAFSLDAAKSVEPAISANPDWK